MKNGKYFLAAAVSAALITGCTTTSIAPAPVTDYSSSQASQTTPSVGGTGAEVIPISGGSGFGGAASSAGTYTVKAGDTLYRIAKNHGVQVNELMRVNGISDPRELAVGRTLTIPGASGAVVPAAAAPAVQVSPVASQPAVSAQPAVQEKPAVSVPVTGDVQTVPGTGEKLIWPVNGTVGDFTAESRGIDIRVPRGTAVKAAASGEVLLISDTIKGYGNLVILRHGDGSFVTTYSQLSSVSVKKGDRVKAGDKIGASGGLNPLAPALHFEVRIAGKPVDPKQYLR